MRELPGGGAAHESAYVDEGAEVGKGTKIWHFCHIMAGARIGEGCSLGQNVVVMPRAQLGRNVKVQNNVSIYEGVVCEDDVFLGPSMVFTNVLNPRSHVSRKHEYRDTLVRRGATIGANATIVCGHTLGEYCFVGAGSVVTRDVPPYARVVGVPARLVGWMCRCGVRLAVEPKVSEGDRVQCAACGTWYVGVEGGVAPGETA
jgi:UDP-2-acetamido-3-amino-2,3-dideoxy-glucuronate N-acetyltransferase